MNKLILLPFIFSFYSNTLPAQGKRLEITPIKHNIDSLESNHLQAVYYVTNKSNDTLNISVTVSFDWCMPRHQPKQMLPGQTDSVFFDCGLSSRPTATSMFTIRDNQDYYPCIIHYSMKRKVFFDCCVPKKQPTVDSIEMKTDVSELQELKVTKQTDKIKRDPITKRITQKVIIQYYSNDKIARRTEIIYYNERQKKKNKGYTNFCKKKIYYSNGKLKQYLEEYNYGYSHTETSPRSEVVIVNKMWDEKGNLIYSKKSNK